MDTRQLHIKLKKIKVLASIVCLWLWLVCLSICYVIIKISSLRCLKCDKDRLFVYPVDAPEIPMIYSLPKTGMTLQFFLGNLIDALRVSGNFVIDVWFHNVDDLTENPIDGDFDESWARNHMEITGDAFDNTSQVNNVPPEERTIFVTFSKGYRVSESELVEFLTSNFGHCVESIHMQAVMFGQQPLYARVVFLSLHFIHTILSGEDKVKFSVNRKHVWMRKYVP